MKRRFLMVPIFLMTACLSGCTPQLTPVETYTHEAGEALKEDVKLYAAFENPEKASEAEVDLSAVVADKVGTYEATIKYKNKEYPFTVEVVDTTAPDGTYQTSSITIGIDGIVTPDLFGIECSDISEISYGFRNHKLVKTEEEISTIIQENMAKAAEEGLEEITIRDMCGIEWEESKDSWDEFGIKEEELTNEFVPKETGLYEIELASRDEYGNTDFTRCYVLADLEAPYMILRDKEITVTGDFEKYMNSLNEGIYAEDNLLGDISSSISIIESSIDETNKSAMKIIASYEVYDLADNRSEGTRSVTAKAQIKETPQSAESSSNGHNRSKAEQAFALVNQQRAAAGLSELVWDESVYNIAATRAEEVASNYSHTRSSTGRTTVEDFNLGENLNKLWGDTSAGATVNSWMNSSGHKANLLTGYYTRSAMACYQSGKYCYYVQLFGF